MVLGPASQRTERSGDVGDVSPGCQQCPAMAMFYVEVQKGLQ